LIEADLASRKARRQYEMQRPLAEKGFVAGRVIRDSRDEYEANRQRSDVLRRAQSTDERLQSSQLAQLRQSASALNNSLGIARGSLDALNLRAPVSGQLTAFSIQVGQSLDRGERLGQIDTEGNKLVAQVDEFYLGRVQEGQIATADLGGKTYRLKLAKIYPQVRNGTFDVDFQFVGPAPANVQRGQTIQTKLTLSDPAKALLIRNGAFYDETRGAWVFVVSPDGRQAVKRQVRLGRRNSEYIEVLEGLEAGERVLTSPYTGFAERDRLDLQKK
jgi:HlyD family secretion protein